jgi:hypothetical protein
VDWIHLARDSASVAESCEHSDPSSGFIKDENFSFDQLSAC